jgi:hypothetical protein
VKTCILISCFLISLTSCTIYTEKRSEALSQAVYATAESINNARFDKAGPYAEQAKRLAYAPKNKISVPPIITSNTKRTESTNNKIDVKKSSSNVKTGSTLNSSVIKATTNTDDEEQFLRLVIPESLKHAKLLIENSDEWNELLQTKKFKEQLEIDNANLKKLSNDIDAELQKQLKYNNQMVIDLNIMQKKLVEKDLLITRLYITIFGLILSIAGGAYLRIKGIL